MEPIPPATFPPPPPPPPPPVPPVIPPRPKKKSFIWLLILVVLFLLATTGVLAYQYYQLKTQIASPAPSPSLAPSPTPTPSPDPTANWKTFTSSNNYQIKYPSDWAVETSSQGFSIKKGDYEIIFSFPSGYGPGICIFSDSPDFTKNDPNDPIMMGSKCPGKYVEVKGERFTFRRKDNPNISPEGIQSGQWSVFVKDKEDNFVTVPPIAYKTPVNYDKSIILSMDLILSTFKFLD